jgi:hypothetical protein
MLYWLVCTAVCFRAARSQGPGYRKYMFVFFNEPDMQ